MLINLAYRNIHLISFGGNIGNLIKLGIEKIYAYFDSTSLTQYEQNILGSGYWKVHKIIMLFYANIVMIIIYFNDRSTNINQKISIHLLF